MELLVFALLSLAVAALAFVLRPIVQKFIRTTPLRRASVLLESAPTSNTEKTKPPSGSGGLDEDRVLGGMSTIIVIHCVHLSLSYSVLHMPCRNFFLQNGSLSSLTIHNSDRMSRSM